MQKWTQLGLAPLPDSDRALSLHQNEDDFVIRITGSGEELMSTRRHGSEDALGRLPFDEIKNSQEASVLIGGLGMGFTLAAALDTAGRGARITVAELLPQVIEWNRGPLGERSGRPLDDPRTILHAGDVTDLLRKKISAYDVIALDIDNGPEGLTSRGNDWLYSAAGISATTDALRPGGVIAYWAATSDRIFPERVARTGARIVERSVHAHGKKGIRHTIWLVSPLGPETTS
ncbi:MAG: hypothetical protein P8K76_07950 [Candidatus Binatia bacterium]|nr:hypothetical protein [Candidatus Binatia bacterium]MDG2009698.1 hypothetical protein [Candidatus Binatia bacterium]